MMLTMLKVVILIVRSNVKSSYERKILPCIK